MAIGLVTIGLAACERPPGTRGTQGKKGEKGDKGDPGSKLRLVTGGAVGRCDDDEVLISALREGSSLYNPLAVTGNQAQCGANPESPDFKIRLVCMKR